MRMLIILIFIFGCSTSNKKYRGVEAVYKAYPELTIYSIPDNAFRYYGVNDGGIAFEIRMYEAGNGVREIVLLNKIR